MKIYDISQEVFGCQVYAGDPAPEKELLSSMEEGGLYNLTAFRMCAHNGTHIDAPFHFIKGGKAVDSIGLDTFVGLAYVAEHHGIVSADDAAAILENGKKQNPEAAKRILIKGDAEVSSEAAKIFAASNILLLGNESQTVGPENAPMEVHRILLGAGIVLLEGIRLAEVSEGVYFLNAAPLNLSGADGSPCRAVLMEECPTLGQIAGNSPSVLENLKQNNAPKMTLNDSEYTVIRLLGKGKGGYSYLVTDGRAQYVLKQIHHEPCEYYTFGDKLQSELRDYETLRDLGIPMPRLLAVDTPQERILKEYIAGPTVAELLKEGRMEPDWLTQVQAMCSLLYPAGLNIDYYPTNFVPCDGTLYYIDYECNTYMEQWDFEHWGSQYWNG